jgi:cytochrome c553
MAIPAENSRSCEWGAVAATAGIALAFGTLAALRHFQVIRQPPVAASATVAAFAGLISTCISCHARYCRPANAPRFSAEQINQIRTGLGYSQDDQRSEGSSDREVMDLGQELLKTNQEGDR